MPAPSAITAIRAGLGIKLGAHKMPAAGTAVATLAENADIINKV